ncbi:Bile salt-activated lipase [Myotis brandtii]|uniref:Bile salt-activated lipase n=1 Tax=Myotis brandtii TaxID=109478 RepID=S7ND25_MYOBR|nr:Bile salt-activated lipase [Myotis brandtii]
MGHLELAVLGLACCLAVVRAAKLGVVHTEGGFVEGVNKKLGFLGIGGRSVDIFKGIPFAALPKALENPQPHPGWQGTLKAKDFKQRCLQLTLTQLNTKGSEDCLYLNIWVPQGKKEVSQNLPVMIWIFGGAFIFGAGQGFNVFSDYLYDGEEIATRGNVIVVTFNYRIGPLGFLSTGDANLPGILSPYNKGLIRRAISQSGVALTPWAIQKNPLFWAKQIAKKVGCPLDDTARMAKCLKVTDPRALMLAYKIPLLGRKYLFLYSLGLLPVVDGDFIPDDPINLFANAADIDYIAGTNDMDGHLFASVDVPAINMDLLTVTGEDIFKLIRQVTIAKGPRGANATFDLYTASWAQDSSQEAKKKTLVELETDIGFLMPTKMAVAQHRANAK